MSSDDKALPLDFIRARVRNDLESGVHREPLTRFPPEPNGYLHLGHAKSICLNFGIAEEFGGRCNLRFDDTNPLKEDQEYVDAMQADIRWLGFQWDGLFYASDYFAQVYQFAEELIQKGLAYVDSQSDEQIRMTRGSLTAPGIDSPHRARSVAENLDLFRRMRAGDFPDGAHVLRAKIDMASPNINLRDPAIYRIRHARHHHTGDAWCIYPLYDFTHCICDALEGITHSLCTLEFEDHRPLYDWFLDNLSVPTHPKQIEFSKLQVQYVVMSKRFYNGLIAEGKLDGWDDPRVPSIAGLRRRGYTAAAIRDFCERAGVTKQENTLELAALEFSLRQDLEPLVPRGMAVLDPIKVIIDNYDGDGEELPAAWHPKNEALGVRTIPFGREVWIEREDFAEQPPKGFKRLSLGGEVRLRYAYVIRCDAIDLDDAGNIAALHCHYYPDSKSGADVSGRKPKGVIHWAPVQGGVNVEVRLYDTLFSAAKPNVDDLAALLNPNSLQRIPGAVAEPALAQAQPEERFQFERQGYFIADVKDSKPGSPVFNRTVTLRDSWKP